MLMKSIWNQESVRDENIEVIGNMSIFNSVFSTRRNQKIRVNNRNGKKEMWRKTKHTIHMVLVDFC